MPSDCPAAKLATLSEVDRIRIEYARRSRELPPDLYGYNRPVNQFFYCQTFRACVNALSREAMFPLNGKRVADIGCGTGNWLLDFVKWGASPDDIAGIDLDEIRIQQARARLPHADLLCGDASVLPWPDASFDLVTQFTVFTSILDAAMRRRLAVEMLRVVKPSGLILWYDFRVDNPKNRNVHGVSRGEILSLFPGCGIKLCSLTLAPPLARRVVNVSWTAALLLEMLPLARTHYLGLIRRLR
jgi:SAM-dependent methyltransferase